MELVISRDIKLVLFRYISARLAVWFTNYVIKIALCLTNYKVTGPVFINTLVDA